MNLSKADWKIVETALEAMLRHLLSRVLEERAARNPETLAAVAEETAADTIYAIDQLAEAAILDWLRGNWPASIPLELVMEGLEAGPVKTFPEGTPPGKTAVKCIIDPIDGTRGIMYDKRSAWMLCGVAPQRGSATGLADIEAAAMMELPTTRQWRADFLSARRGAGARAIALDLRDPAGDREFRPIPSKADEVRHAFGTIARFFPAGLALLGEVEEALWSRLYGTPDSPSPLVFNDQYISTGGQFYEMLAGRDRFIADLRPLAFRKLGIEANLCCHPYDVACALILEEAGCVIEQPDGSPLDCPLDTTTPVSWVAYANQQLADSIRSVLRGVIEEHLV